MLAHHLERLLSTGIPVIVATTTNSADDPIASLAHVHGASVFRGDEHDVLHRFASAARQAEVDTIVRVTADCPLIDPALIVRGVRRYVELGDPHAHVSNVLQRTYPRGFDFEVFSALALADADRMATEHTEREHVTPYLYTNRSGSATIHAITQNRDASRYRVTLDTDEDLRVIRELIEVHGADELSVSQIIEILDSHPDLVAMNKHVEQKKLGE